MPRIATVCASTTGKSTHPPNCSAASANGIRPISANCRVPKASPLPDRCISGTAISHVLMAAEAH